MPVFDEEIGAVIGYKTQSQGIIKILGKKGQTISLEEVPLKSPIMSPIDIIYFAGLAVISVRKIIHLASTTSGKAAVGQLSIAALSKNTLSKLRTVFKSTPSVHLSFTRSTVKNMKNPDRYVPLHILQLAVKYGRRSVDPRGTPEANKYTIPIRIKDSKRPNGKNYNIQVILR